MTSNDINREIGVRLSAWMIQRGVDARDMASAINTSRQRLARIQNGQAPMTAAELVGAARKLGVSMDALTGSQQAGGAQ